MAMKPIASYIAVLAPDRVTGGYAVFFPDLPGCVTQGENLADAQAMAAEALSGWIASMMAHREPIPTQRALDAIRADKVFAREHDVDWREAIVILVAVRPPLGQPERVNVSLDSNWLRAIDAYAERRGLTRSAVLEAGAELLLDCDPFEAERPGANRAATRPKPAGKPKKRSKHRN